MGLGDGNRGKTARCLLTCRALSATLECSVLLSCVSSCRMAASSSVSVGSRPHSWSCNAPPQGLTQLLTAPCKQQGRDPMWGTRMKPSKILLFEPSAAKQR